MNNFFSKIQKGFDDAGQKRQQGRQNSQPPAFRNPFAKKSQFNDRGGGKSLGGTLPGRVIRITLSEAGPLGLMVEKRPHGNPSAIVSSIIPNSQAEKAGLKRGDIICHLDSNGQEEVQYKEFLAHAANQRPLIFDIRRVDTPSVVDSGTSADAFARKQAIISAAEARDRGHRAKTRPSKPNPPPISKNIDTPTVTYDHTQQPLTEESRIAIQQTKKEEQLHAKKLGYNPYETARMNSGQAKTATVNKTHGVISDNSDSVTDNNAAANTQAPSPVNVANSTNLQGSDSRMVVDEAFDEAFITLVTTSQTEDAVKSLTIIRKLIINATTKGQAESSNDTESAAKFRRVRLSNPKINETITHRNGAIDVMMACGFVLSDNELDGETYLAYPPGTTGPPWLQLAFAKIERYCQETK